MDELQKALLNEKKKLQIMRAAAKQQYRMSWICAGMKVWKKSIIGSIRRGRN